MRFEPTKVPDVYVIEPELIEDERGFFARTWCQQEFVAHGLNSRFVQCSISYNRKKGTLRGMHYQVPPHQEVKLVRVTRGRIYDVAIDLRPDSRTFEHWVAVELTAANRKMLYVPEGVAHGFQTLVDDTEVFYQMSELHHAECACGVRWDDPQFNIQWPLPVSLISEKDRNHEDFE